MEFQPELYLRFIISISFLIDSYFIYFLFQPIDFRLAYSCFFIPFLLMDEFCIFSHIGFTYTTYITVKGEFFIIYI